MVLGGAAVSSFVALRRYPLPQNTRAHLPVFQTAQTVKSWPVETKSRLLQFVTGSSRLPVNGFRDLQGSDGPRRFTIEKATGGERGALPKSHTVRARASPDPIFACSLLTTLSPRTGACSASIASTCLFTDLPRRESCLDARAKAICLKQSNLQARSNDRADLFLVFPHLSLRIPPRTAQFESQAFPRARGRQRGIPCGMSGLHLHSIIIPRRPVAYGFQINCSLVYLRLWRTYVCTSQHYYILGM